MFALGVMLVLIGVAFVIPRGMFPGLSGGLFPSPRDHPGMLRPVGKLNGVLIGLGVMALGGLCIAFGS
jgi:hypothetical protein